MTEFLKEVCLEFIVNPFACYRRLRSDRQQARFWQQVQKMGGNIYVRPENIPGVFSIDLRSHVALQILEQGAYEKDVTDYMGKVLLDKPGVIVNVGANVGLMAVFLCKKFERKTIAIEPNPEAYELLQKNILLNAIDEQVSCVQACISAKEGQVDFSFVKGKPEYSSMGGIVHPCVNSEKKEMISVPAKPLNDVVNDEVALIFSDTEGAEGLVLDGAQQIIERDHPVIMCECSDLLLRKFGTSANNVVARLLSHHYRLYDVATGDAIEREVPDGFNSNVLAIYNR